MLKVYNTLTRKNEKFVPLQKKGINLFVCGPTVYDHAHLGHAKSYIQFDVIVRYLRYREYNVFYLQNITDIDDKILNRAQEAKKDWKEVKNEFEQSYLSDMQQLNCTSVDAYARATEYIKEIIGQIQRLQKKGIAYEIDDGVYFDISKFPGYGRLSHQNLELLRQHRIEPNPQKRNNGDFSLWKKHKLHEPASAAWDSPWGRGRPGWHIEDTAITEKFFGPQYDLHGGGMDLIFPHHEAEIAQMEALSGKPLVKYWLHNGYLKVRGEKMSKSLKNFVTIKEALQQWGPMPLRFLFATTHYRDEINFVEDSILAAKKGVEKLKNTLLNLNARIDALPKRKGKADTRFLQESKEHKKQFIKEMDNDFNTPRAVAILFELSSDVHQYLTNNPDCARQTLEKAKALFLELASVFGFLLEETLEIPKKVHELVQKREWARSEKNWKESDRLRAEITKLGWQVDDTKEGPLVKKGR